MPDYEPRIETPSILVDSREPQDVIASLQQEFPEAIVTSLGTDCGDFLAILSNGNLVVERKEPNDLVSSIADNHLFSQSEHIPRLARFPFLLVDGELRYSEGGFFMRNHFRIGFQPTQWHRTMIEGAIERAQMNGMMIALYESEPYPKRLRRLIDLCLKADNPHTTRAKSRNANPFDDGTQAKIDFLASLPNVGTERAANLVQAYPDQTIAGLLQLLTQNGSSVTRKKVPLWGIKTFESIKSYLGLRTGQYLKIDELAEWSEAV